MDFDALHKSANLPLVLYSWEKAVFLDRDGVITYENPLERAGDFLELIPGAERAIRRLNDSGLRVVVVTNQPRVGRAQIREERLWEIHERLLTDLRRSAGAKIDLILYCPHCQDASIPEFRLDCPWRKPKPGMLQFVGKRFGVDLTQSFMVGDRASDILSGQAVGARTILVRTPRLEVLGDPDPIYSATPHFESTNLESAIDVILSAS